MSLRRKEHACGREIYSAVVKEYGEHISADDGTCIHKLQLLKPNTSSHPFSYEKTFIERAIQYIKDRTGFFDILLER